MVSYFSAVNKFLVALIVIFSFYFIFSVLAIFGTSKGKHWFMLPWIIYEFILLAILTGFLITIVIIMSVYVKENSSSSAISTGVVSLAFCGKLNFERIWNPISPQ